MRNTPVSGLVLDDAIEISLEELCRACGKHEQWVIALVSEGVLNPRGKAPAEWRFPGSTLRVARTAQRLESDLGVNLAGVALALDLLAEIERLSIRVHRLSDLEPN